MYTLQGGLYGKNLVAVIDTKRMTVIRPPPHLRKAGRGRSDCASEKVAARKLLSELVDNVAVWEISRITCREVGQLIPQLVVCNYVDISMYL